jgi:hypothetical protein
MKRLLTRTTTLKNSEKITESDHHLGTKENPTIYDEKSSPKRMFSSLNFVSVKIK